MRVAVIQAASGLDKPANVALAAELIDDAARNGCDLVVLPEAFMHDFGPAGADLAGVAEPLDGPFVTALAGFARKHECVVVAGMFETSADPVRPYNTVVALGADGALLACYRKAHLYDSFGYRESERLLAGDPQPVVVGVGGLRIGLMTCYDVRFPEFSRLLLDAGADALAVPAAWVRGPLKEDHWVTLTRARAIENTCFVFGAGQCGTTYIGRSLIVDPMGVPLASLGEQVGVAVAEVDPARLAEVRAVNPSVANRRIR